MYARNSCARGDHGQAYQLADTFCRQSRIRIDELFGRLWSNTDDLDDKVVREILDGSYIWLEEGVIDASTEGPWIADATPGPAQHENVHRRIP